MAKPYAQLHAQVIEVAEAIQRPERVTVRVVGADTMNVSGRLETLDAVTTIPQESVARCGGLELAALLHLRDVLNAQIAQIRSQ
jgi:hypothetical protein